MADDLKRGETVEWRSSGGTAVGEVKKKLTSETTIKGHTAKASEEDPQYLVESDASGAQAAHKPDALKRVT